MAQLVAPPRGGQMDSTAAGGRGSRSEKNRRRPGVFLLDGPHYRLPIGSNANVAAVEPPPH